MRSARVLATSATSAVLLLTCVAAGAAKPAAPGPADTPPPSTYVGTASVEEHGSVATASDGDLWPSCWADDGSLYAANGDGKGFSLDQPPADIAVSRIEGAPPSLTGETVAAGDQVGQIWSGPGYNRKPTGMVCVGDTIYLAVQDLALDFNDVPAATIVKSTDGGRTWTWDHSAPMFDNHVFTTIWFADYGQGGREAPDKYVYAYGLDGNWRDSFDDSVQDPQDLWLARVPSNRVQDRSAWEFFSGTADRPAWSKKLSDRRPVLRDTRRVYQELHSTRVSNLSVLSQGGVTYVPQLHRYLYASWTEYTFEFYESPTPWGPWKLFLSKDFGGYPWTQSKHGGYATTIPSKFISEDGKSMWVQSNVCPCGGGGTSVYDFNLRKLHIEPASSEPAANEPDATVNLADPSFGAVAISKSSHYGRLDRLNDGVLTAGEDDWDDEVKTRSWWGYTWPRRYLLDRVDFTSGERYADGGWFAGRPVVEVRRDGVWTRADAQATSPAYDPTKPYQTYTFTFAPVEADGVRIAGLPGGDQTFTSVAEVSAGYRTQVTDGGFEAPGTGASAWGFEGGAAHGVDRGLGFAHSGANNGWIRTSGTGWSAYTQTVPVKPGATYTFSAWTRSSAALADGRFGVRVGDQVLGEERFGATPDYTKRTAAVTVPDGVHEVTVYAGFDGPGTDTWLQLDDVTVE